MNASSVKLRVSITFYFNSFLTVDLTGKQRWTVNVSVGTVLRRKRCLEIMAYLTGCRNGLSPV